MKLLACVVTFNRLEYTQRTVETIRDGADFLVVVDNYSTDGTQQWLMDAPVDLRIFNGRNLFPGAATNIGWFHGLKRFPDADLLMRSDNDIEYLSGWRAEVDKAFEAHPDLVQLGVLNRHEDYNGRPPSTPFEANGYAVNTHWDQFGGNTVMHRDMWDAGVRWEPGSWSPGARDEDSRMAAELRRHGMVAGLIPTIANNLSYHRFHDYPDYYRHTAGLRGLVAELSV